MRSARDKWYDAERAKHALKQDGWTQKRQLAAIKKMGQQLALKEQRQRESRDNGGICVTGQHEFVRIEPTCGYDFACSNCGLGVQDDE